MYRRAQIAEFQLVTTITVITVTDCWKGYNYALRGSKSDEEIAV
jgi:hypothetical protein